MILFWDFFFLVVDVEVVVLFVFLGLFLNWYSLMFDFILVIFIFWVCKILKFGMVVWFCDMFVCI